MRLLLLFVRLRQKWELNPRYLKKWIFMFMFLRVQPQKMDHLQVLEWLLQLFQQLTGIAVKKDIAMTGEVTLRGNVLPIGGLKEKLLAALRGGITTVLIPAENEKDLKEIPSNVKEGLVIIPVSHVTEVLKQFGKIVIEITG